MAARDVKLYLSLKKALLDKVANPHLSSHTLEVDGASRSYDYEYIFQTARRVFPQKYNLGHSYLVENNQRTPISNLQSDDLAKLNMEYAKAIVEGWTGNDPAFVNNKQLDSVLLEYENELTAPDEPDYLYDELQQKASPQPQEEQQSGERQSSGQESSGESSAPQQASHSQTPITNQGPLTNKQKYGTKENYAAAKEANKESRNLKASTLWDRRKRQGMTKEDWTRHKSENQDERRGRAERLRNLRKEEEDKRRALGLLRNSSRPGWNPLGDWLAKKVGQKIAQSRLGQAVARNFVDPLKQAVANSKAMQAIAPRLQPLANALDKIASPFRAVSHALGAPERWLNNNILNPLQNWAGNAIRNLGSQAIRSGINQLGNLFNSGRSAINSLRSIPPIALPAAGAGIFAAISLGPLLLLITLIGGFLFAIWSIYDAESGCGKPGTPQLTKSVVNGQIDSDGEKKFTINDEIEYSIIISYNLKCGGNLNAEVRDTLPQNTEYVLGSSNSPTYNIYSQSGTSNMLTFDSSQQDRTLVWNIKGLPNNRPFEIRFKVRPTLDNAWIVNETTTRFTIFTAGVGGGGPGGRVIDSQSASFNQVLNEAAQNVGMDPALLKAILKVEAGRVLDYSEEEFLRFSTPGWWESADEESIRRGYAYNTCADPTAGCGAGNDVRGVAQFELATWRGIAPQLQFADGHEPDRRNARDAIFGSAVLNRRNAESYAGTSNIEWTEDVVRAMARMYCAGPGAGRNPELARHRACGWNGTRGYDDFVWDYYRQFSGQI